MKYFVGLVVAVGFFFGFVYLHDLVYVNGDASLVAGIGFFLAIAVPVGILAGLCVSLKGKLVSAQQIFDLLIRAYIAQIRWVFADSSRVGSHAEQLLIV